MPGAPHRARWMARVIYSIKICLFQERFVMTRREQSGIKRFATFAVIVYIRSWFLAPEAVRAPANNIYYCRSLPRIQTVLLKMQQVLGSPST